MGKKPKDAAGDELAEARQKVAEGARELATIAAAAIEAGVPPLEVFQIAQSELGARAGGRHSPRPADALSRGRR